RLPPWWASSNGRTASSSTRPTPSSSQRCRLRPARTTSVTGRVEWCSWRRASCPASDRAAPITKPASTIDPRRRRRLALLRGLVHCFVGAAMVLLLDDAGALAAQAAQVIELGAAHLAAAHDFDRVDHRRIEREHAFHALAVGNLAHGEILVQP